MNIKVEDTITLILTVLNAVSIIYFAWKKNKPEVKKLEAESESEIVEAAERNLESAKISNQMLIDRINELKMDLENEKKARKEDLEQQRISMQARLDAEVEARKKKTDYLERRVKESDREARDYRLWAAKLVKQVVESGKVPVPFIPSSVEDSDPALAAIGKENQRQVAEKWEERKDDAK